VICDLAVQNGKTDPSLWAASDYPDKNAPYTSVWGTDQNGDDFCCSWDNSRSWKPWTFRGTENKDHVYLGDNSPSPQFSFCDPDGTGPQIIIKILQDDDDVLIQCNTGLSSFGFTRIMAGPGDDTINARGWLTNGSPGAVTAVYGDVGADVIYGAATTPNQIYGGPGDDVIEGGDDEDVLRGEAGADLLVGNKGADVLYAGPANEADVLDGRDGGGDDADTLFAWAGQDADAPITGFSTGLDECQRIYGGVSLTWAGPECIYGPVHSDVCD